MLSSDLQLYKFQVTKSNIREKDSTKKMGYKLYTQNIYHLPQVKVNLLPGLLHPKGSHSNPKRFLWKHPTKRENTTIELPNDEDKLFDEEDDVGNSFIPDLSLPSEDEGDKATLNSVWEYAINDLIQLSPLHAEGKSLGNWVKFQEMHTIEQFY